jgi:uncharacterized repeat protein (TIGR03803 family)
MMAVALACGTLTAFTSGCAQAATYKELYEFKGGSDGAYPFAGLVMDSARNAYGTTNVGGAYNAGTVFKLAPNGSKTVLYSFKGGTGDGGYPSAGLVRDSAGNLYGTTASGRGSGCNGLGCGTVFKLALDGSETVLYSFTGGSDGANPNAGLIRDASGNLYGTATYGGAGCGSYGCGVVFKLARSGTESVLNAFKA